MAKEKSLVMILVSYILNTLLYLKNKSLEFYLGGEKIR